MTRDNLNNEFYEDDIGISICSNFIDDFDRKSKVPKTSYKVEEFRNAKKLFNDSIPMFMYETDGSTIKSEQHKLDLSDGKAKITLTFPLKSKVKRNNTAKKKENVYGPAISQDNWLFQPSGKF